MGVDDAGDRDPAARELLDDHRVGRQVEAHAAVLLGDRHPEQAELLHLLDDRLGERVLVVVVLGVGDDLLVGELTDHFDDRLLLVGHFAVRGGVYGHGSCSSVSGKSGGAGIVRRGGRGEGYRRAAAERGGRRRGLEQHLVDLPLGIGVDDDRAAGPDRRFAASRTIVRIATERSQAPPAPNQPIAPE